MESRVAAFTDTYFPTINGVTYTIKSWRDRWEANGGRMDVVYPRTNGYTPDKHEHSVRSLPFPFYDGYRLSFPRIPRPVRDTEIVHAHTPFGIGLGGLRLSRKTKLPFVASYHTPTREYVSYLVSSDLLAPRIKQASDRYERWFYQHADMVVTPSEATKRYVTESVGVDAPVSVLSNGVDVTHFQPGDGETFRRKYGIDADRPVVGYTGRHGYEKRLTDIVTAAADMDITVVLSGDGPARRELEQQAERNGADVRFLGFLDRSELPAFYSSLDVFAFPSPVETQGLVALEANACGTPVVGANRGALANTIDDGETGYHFETGDAGSLQHAIQRTLDEQDRLRETCLDRRDSYSVDHVVDELTKIYEQLTE